MKNIFDMLKPGGDIVFTIISCTPIYDFWENMAKTDEWAPYSKDVSDLVSPYHHLKEPSYTLRKYLEDAGFVIHVWKVDNCSYEFSDFLIFLSNFLKMLPP